MRSTTSTRLAASLIFAAIAATLALRIWLNMQDNGNTLLQALWSIFRYFTNWTNALAGLAMLWVALGARVPVSAISCLLMCMALVSGVYYGVLYGITQYEGLDILVDWMLHTVNPLGVLIFWLFFVNKSELRFGHTAYWQLYPIGYCAYALIRGLLDGVYPYPFIRPSEIGWLLVVRNIAILSAVFIPTGLLVVALGRWLDRRTNSS